MATAAVGSMALIVPMAGAADVAHYDYKGKVWTAHPDPSTPGVGGHPLTAHGHAPALPKGAKPVNPYRAAAPRWPAAGTATVSLNSPTTASATPKATPDSASADATPGPSGSTSAKTKRTDGATTTAQATPRAKSSSSATPSPALSADASRDASSAPASPVRAGSLPVWVSAVPRASTSRNATAAKADTAAAMGPASVRVQLAGHTQAQAAGVDGILAGFSRADGSGSAGSAQVTLDYSAIARAYGGGWASRLHLVTMPACALTTPDVPKCRVRTPLAASNDFATGKLTATVPLAPATRSATANARATSPAAKSAAVTAVAAVSGTSGSQGSYTATSLNPSGTWSASGTGAFTYSYPVTVPASLGGSAPSVALSYDSQSVDGETSARNSQSSWIGDGWSYSPGFIERSYKSCGQDGISDSGDQCWGGANLTLALDGHSGTLVRDDSANPSDLSKPQVWHIQGDDGTKVEELSGADNGLWNGEYFKVTTTDGVAYYFGIDHAPGQTSDSSTDSAWGEPVYSPDSGDPCYDPAKGKDSECLMGYRFNLDFVVDTHSNTQRYDYAAETNYYDMGGGQVASSGGSGTLTKYVRGGYLKQISYGYQLADAAAGHTPAARVVFNTAQRCQTSSSFTDCSYGNLSDSTATNWPDVPYDLNCDSTDKTSGSGTGTCLVGAPTFWSTYRLDSITTQVNVGGTLTNVDSYQLKQVYSDAGGVTDPVTGKSVDPKDAGELQSVMWLNSIQHTGEDRTAGATSAITLPPVTFTGIESDNRVDGLTPAAPPLYRPRISAITTETGESIGVTYAPPDCSRVNNTMPSSPDSDTMSCFNAYWTTPGGADPISDWFNKTRVQQVTVTDDSGAGSPTQETDYSYSGAAWHRDDSPLTPDKYRTWDQFRGYRTVTVTTGSGTQPITKNVTTYLQGMDGDLTSDGTARSVTVTDSVGDKVTDSDQLAGTALESDTYTSASGSVDSKSVSGPWTFTTTATQSQGSLPDLTSHMLKSEQTRGYSLLSNGQWRETETDTSYNADAQPITVDSKGDVSVPSQEKCGTVSYATPPSGNPMMLSYPDEALVVAGPCGTAPGTSTTIADKRLFYDGDGTVTNPGTLGHLGTTGNLTAVQMVSGYSGSTPAYRTTSATAYDTYGRATQSLDADGEKTTTAFTPATGQLPATTTSTNPRGWVTTSQLDPLRELPVEETDANKRDTVIQYDALGRRTAVWLPGRDATSQSADTTFSYAINGTSGPSTVTTETLREDESYAPTIDIYDGMLQLRQVQTKTADNSAGRLITDTFYDTHGWAWKSNAAYYEPTSDPSTTMWVAKDNQIPSQTLTLYDGQGRPIHSQMWSKAQEQWQSTTAYPGADRTDSTPPAGGTATSTFTNALGQTTATWSYDDSPTPTGNAKDAVATTYTYTPAGQISTMSDNAGNQWSYHYDLLGEETQQSDPDTGTTTFDKYDDTGDLLQTTDPRGQVLSYAYDDLGRKTAEYSGNWSATPDASKELASWSYDSLADGYPTSSTRYVGGASGDAYTEAVTGYNTAYQPTGSSVTIPADAGFPGNGTGSTSNTYSTTTEYSPNVGLLAQTDYGKDGGLPQESVGYSYDLQGLVVGFGGNTAYLDNVNYTPYGQAIDATWGLYGEQLNTTASYDPATGRLATSSVNLQPSAGKTALDNTTYGYDQAGDLTTVSDSQNGGAATDTQCFTYDDLQRLTTAWTDTAGTTTPTAGSVASCKTTTPSASTIGGPAPYWQSYSYDLLGDRTQEVMHDTSGNTANDVTQSISYPGSGATAAPTPNAASQVTTTGPDGTSTLTPSYDTAGDTFKRTVTTSGPFVAGPTRSGTKLCLDDSSSGTTNGNKIDVWTCNGSAAQKLTVGTDGTVQVLGKCLDVTKSGTANGTPVDLWTCNGSGAQQWKAAANGTLVNPESGKCLDDPSSSTTNGTQLEINTCAASTEQRWTNADANLPVTGSAQSFTYDAEGRTASVTTPSGGTDQTTNYLYDADGNLLVQTTPTSKILYLFGGAEQLTLTTASGAVSGLRYYSGPDGTTECRSSTGTLTYEVATTQGTATTEIDASTLAVTRRYYDPYGAPRGTQPSNWADNKGYLGKPSDPTTGLDLLGARQYDPNQGGFLTPDPILEAGDPNQMGGYTYAADNPTTGSDPTGLMYNLGDGPPPGYCDAMCQAEKNNGSIIPSGSGGGSSGSTSSSPPPSSCSGKFVCDVSNAQHDTTPPPTPMEALQAIGISIGLTMIGEGFADCEVVTLGLATPGCYLGAAGAVDGLVGMMTGSDSGGSAIGGVHDEGSTPDESAPSGSDPTSAASRTVENSTAKSEPDVAAAKHENSEERAQSASTGEAEPSTPAKGTPEKASTEGGCSFAPSTPVLMAGHKTKPIGEIKPGDKVESANASTGAHDGSHTVTATWVNHDHDLVDVKVETSPGHTAVLHTTSNHPFWDATTHAWLPAGILKPGHELATENGQKAYVVSVRATPGAANRYNLTVSQDHTYYVLAGATPVLVHNTCGDPVYRGDARPPKEVKAAGGFMPQDPSSEVSLLDYASDIRNKARYVGTSKSPDIAATYFGGPEGYLYEIRGAPHGIDVNNELGPLSPSPHEKEIAFDGGIPWEYVTRVWKKDEWGEVDIDYDEPIWER
ncbi:hypothetical protein CK485_16480 [Streptomyces sp. ICBB 8177]|nr:hypothetical protein CK485_16480 [Streptomyces sp. ICBB 8177]